MRVKSSETRLFQEFVQCPQLAKLPKITPHPIVYPQWAPTVLPTWVPNHQSFKQIRGSEKVLIILGSNLRHSSQANILDHSAIETSTHWRISPQFDTFHLIQENSTKGKRKGILCWILISALVHRRLSFQTTLINFPVISLEQNNSISERRIGEKQRVRYWFESKGLRLCCVYVSNLIHSVLEATWIGTQKYTGKYTYTYIDISTMYIIGK